MSRKSLRVWVRPSYGSREPAKPTLDSNLAQEIDDAPHAARERRMLRLELHGDALQALRQGIVLGSPCRGFRQTLDVWQDLRERTMGFRILPMRIAQLGVQFGEAFAQ